MAQWIVDRYGAVRCSACGEKAICYRDGEVLTKWQRTPFCPYCGEMMGIENSVVTNYERLIRFPVEKLAKVIQCTKWFDPKIECDENLDCYMCKLRWLKKEGTI